MAEPATLVIKAQAEAVKEARDFVAAIFDSWGMEDFLARVVISELATNALKHGTPDEDGHVIIRAYQRMDGRAVLEAWDRSDEQPVPRPENHAAECGRG
ncbi:ATP-binding protein, partial [Actinomadura adrarensis]